MELLRSGWKSMVGGQPSETEPTVAETIEKLLDRVKTSTLLEDRRDACRALKSLAKTYRVEVGAQGLETLIAVLEIDRSDNETLSYALDSLCCIITGPNEDPADYSGIKSPEEDTEDLGIQFTEIFAKRKENVATLLDLFEEFDFKVRWPALKLLMGLLKNRSREVQDCILAHAGGVSKLMDLLADSRDIVRNDAILLLVHLTRGNANIQKIVAFENAFDKIFQIMSEEGYTDGGVVVEDCLIVLQNLLKNNTSNQNFFREGSYIQRLMPFLDIAAAEIDWTAQKISNILFLYQVIRALVSPTNPSQTSNGSQKIMLNCGILARLCTMLMASGVPSEILTETINTVSEIIRGDHYNQEFFSKVTAPTDPPRTILVVLLMSMVNEKQALDLRCAILYCFQCFLYKNELGQAQVVETLLPNSTDVSVVTAGQLLCGGLFSNDALTNWLSTLALSHALVDNKTQKEQLLRVQLATNPNAPPTSLMQQCCSMLQQGRFQKRAGLLVLLSTWLSNCPLAVAQFLSMPTNVPLLTSQISLVEGDDLEILIQGLCSFLLGICVICNDNSVPSFTKDDIVQLIVKRAGLETFIDKLAAISKHPIYSKANQKPQLKFKKADDLIFDFEFCKLLKVLEQDIIRALQAKPNDQTNGPESYMTPGQNEIVLQYQNVIRKLDQEVKDLRLSQNSLTEEYRRMKAEYDETVSTNAQLRDQLYLLKVHRSVNEASPMPMASFAEEGNAPQLLDDFRRRNEDLQRQLDEANAALANLRLTALDSQPPQQHFNHVLQPPQATVLNFEPTYIDQNGTSATLVPPVGYHHHQQPQQQAVYQDSTYNDALQQRIAALEQEQAKSNSELESFRKEQEDLLLLLTDQDTKIREYKKRLTALGQPVEDGDE